VNLVLRLMDVTELPTGSDQGVSGTESSGARCSCIDTEYFRKPTSTSTFHLLRVRPACDGPLHNIWLY